MTGVKAKKKISRPLTYYMILGVPPAADIEFIHKRYLDLAFEYHPDRGGDEDRFKAIALAWGTLKNKESRKNYDMKLYLEGNNCARCDGRGIRSGFQNGRYHKDVLCEVCDGTGAKR